MANTTVVATSKTYAYQNPLGPQTIGEQSAITAETRGDSSSFGQTETDVQVIFRLTLSRLSLFFQDFSHLSICLSTIFPLGV